MSGQIPNEGAPRRTSVRTGAITRRRMLFGAAATLATATNAFAFEPLRVRRVDVDLPVSGLPAFFDGYRIAHLTDLHLSSTTPAALLDAAVETANAARPDLVAVTGDYVTSPSVHPFPAGAAYAEAAAAIVGRLAASDGVYAVLGNHDHWTDANRVARSLAGAGLRVLRNEGARLVRGDDSLWIAGLDDLSARATDLDAALAGRAADECVLALTHNPDSMPDFVERGVASALAGHTHGGQIRLPFLPPPYVPSRFGAKYAYGVFREAATSMWVSSGIGTIGIPARFCCPAEIAIVTLRRAADR